MRKIFGLLVFVLVLSVSFTCFPKDLKIGYVDIIEVFNDYQKTKDYEGVLDVEKKEIEKVLNKKREEIERLNNKMSLLKEKEKEAHQEKIREQIKEYQEIRRQAEVDMRKMVIEQMTEIKKDMDKVIEDYSKKKKFNLVFDKNSVLFGDKAMDITKDILSISNKQYRKKK